MNTLLRIKEYINYKGLTNQAFEKQTGLSNGTLAAQIKKGGTIGVDKLVKILTEFPNLNPNWLLTGNGEMELGNTLNEPREIYSLRTDQLQEFQKIPLYNIEASAGLIPIFENGNSQLIEDYLVIPRVPKCDGAIHITGDSMYPLLKSGDIVAYKQIHDLPNEIFWGEMYLISVEVAGEEYISVKYVQKSEKGIEWIKLVSENRHHQDKDVKLSKVRAMALVKASVRINSMG